MAQEEYLGDGLYAKMDDSGMIVLRAPRSEGDHWVGLEPEVFIALLKFAKQFWKIDPKVLQ